MCIIIKNGMIYTEMGHISGEERLYFKRDEIWNGGLTVNNPPLIEAGACKSLY